MIDELTLTSLTMVKARDRINFHGTLDLRVTLQAHEEDGIKAQYPGEFEGYIDGTGMRLESVSADTCFRVLRGEIIFLAQRRKGAKKALLETR
jgi:hypothetical protein